jgi:N-methylhydantoinase A
VRIPVIDMVEIGAGGGSIARIDALRRIVVGPDSAGASPGPACYDSGGTQPTVTDADVVLGRIDLTRFAGGKIKLDPMRALRAVTGTIASPLAMPVQEAARGIAEIVDETMASAARGQAVENGKEVGADADCIRRARCMQRGWRRSWAFVVSSCRWMPASV